jgi:hypothetical protein
MNTHEEDFFIQQVFSKVKGKGAKLFNHPSYRENFENGIIPVGFPQQIVGFSNTTLSLQKVQEIDFQ